MTTAQQRGEGEQQKLHCVCAERRRDIISPNRADGGEKRAQYSPHARV